MNTKHHPALSGANAITLSAAAFWIVALALIFASPVLAAQKVNTNGTNYAISGYDPVSYFTDSKAIRGTKKFTHERAFKTWRFRSIENRDEFASMPEKYTPAYGGFCAYGVAQGYTVKIDPRAFTVEDGKLYLNYSKGIKKRFDSDRPGYISKANANWPALGQE